MIHQELIKNIIKRGYLKTPEIIKAFQQVDRRDFVLPEDEIEPYGDYPLSIGFGQTISQPSTVAFMFELLQPKEGDIVLDVGSGSAWTTALLSEIVGERGFVYGVELVPELVDFGRDNLATYGFDNTEIYQASAGILGLPEQGPYDKILVSAAGYDLPEELVEQLKVGGRMVIPVDDSILKVDKVSEDDIQEERYHGFAFVPLKY
jgi:protein-L-isoaspartate(D-aspartate) O-methyltransferase